MDAPPDSSCVLVTEVLGEQALAARLSVPETERAVDRYRHRAARAIDAFRGRALVDSGALLVAAFERADDGIYAAREIRKRVSQLPPVSGVSLKVRVSVHGCGTNPAPDGSAVDEARRMLRLAQPNEVLISGDAVQRLSAPLRALIGSHAQHPDGNLAVFHLQDDFSVTDLHSFSEAALLEATDGLEQQRRRLLLRHHNSAYLVSETHPVVLIGREEGNDIVVVDRRASRHHARIEWRNGRYLLIDASTNGTHVVKADGSELIIKQGELPLPTAGRIGFGFTPGQDEPEGVSFETGESGGALSH